MANDLRVPAAATLLATATLLAGCVVRVAGPAYAPPPPAPVYAAPAYAAPAYAAAAPDGGDIQAAQPPPPLPDYDQPPPPDDGYLWTPGYWAFGPGGYYWVPGTWVQPPRIGVLWTPGYWGLVGAVYVFHAGYWGPHVGFYGGVHYGFGYTGEGYAGGRWVGNSFAYNRDGAGAPGRAGTSCRADPSADAARPGSRQESGSVRQGQRWPSRGSCDTTTGRLQCTGRRWRARGRGCTTATVNLQRTRQQRRRARQLLPTTGQQTAIAGRATQRARYCDDTEAAAEACPEQDATRKAGVTFKPSPCPTVLVDQDRLGTSRPLMTAGRAMNSSSARRTCE
jgi:hypothetical protein